MRNRLSVGLLGFAALLAPLPAAAGDWYVTSGGTGAQTGANWDNALPTVTAGLQLAQPGDTVSVWAGIYQERITLKPGVTLSGGFFFTGRYPFLSILDGGSAGSVVTVPQGVGPSTVLDGFTVMNGSGTGVGGQTRGGGVYCVNAKPTFRNCHFTGNHAEKGGGLFLSNAACDISLCHFTNNRAEHGGAVYCENGSPPIYICTFRHNTADGSGGAVAATATPMLMLACNVFEANRAAASGSAVLVAGGTVLNNTFIRNTGLADAALSLSPGDPVTVANNIVAGNAAGIRVAPGASASIHHNDVVGNAAGNYSGTADLTGADGNISREPALVDPLAGDYTPCPGSPCVDKGDDSLVQTGWNDYYLKPRIQGVSADIGVAEWTQPAPKLPVYVRPDGDDANDGLSWATAKGHLQAAVAQAMQSGREVWVAAGTYYTNVGISNGNVMLYGGFAGTETKRNQRDPAANPTILDGLSSGSVITIISDLAAGHDIDNNTVVDGFTIRNGGGFSDGGSSSDGGGVFISGARPIISGNVIESCSAGLPDGSGGGIWVQGWLTQFTDPTVIACNTFRKNHARFGGGVCVSLHKAVIRNNVIEGNQAHNWNDLPGEGGGVAYDLSAVTITGNVVRNNSAGRGGGVACKVNPLGGSSAVIRGNRIAENGAEAAGGIRSIGDVQILNNVITDNEGYTSTGGISLSDGKATVANNLIARNKAAAQVGGLGASYTDLNLYNNTFVGNDARAIHLAFGNTVNVASNVIANSPTGIFASVPAPGALTLSSNCLFGNTKDYDATAPGATDIQADPRFVNAAAGDYHLLFTSPCIDHGLDTAATGDWDLDGQQRLRGAHVDIGAYEFTESGVSPLAGALAALRIAGGIDAATGAAMAALNVEHASASAGRIDLLDAARLLRTAMGL